MSLRPPRAALYAVMLAAAAAAGCVSIGVDKEGSATTQYRLADEAAGVPAPAPAQPVARELLVAPLPGSNLDDSFSLAFSRSPQTRAPYQFATWSERPSTQLAKLLVERLAARRSFASVALLGRGVGGDLQLNIAVADFYHDAAADPGAARVRVDAELVDRLNRRLIARQSFAASAPVPQANAAGAAAALSRAGSQVLDQLVAWLETTAAAPPSAARAAE